MIVLFRDIRIVTQASHEIGSRFYTMPLEWHYAAKNWDETPNFYKRGLAETGSKVKRVDAYFGQRMHPKEKDRRGSDSKLHQKTRL